MNWNSPWLRLLPAAVAAVVVAAAAAFGVAVNALEGVAQRWAHRDNDFVLKEAAT